MLRAAVVGLGPIGNVHARHYATCAHAQLGAVCDILPGRADAAAAAYGVPAFYSVRELLDGVEVDICDICTGGEEYGSDHYAPTMEALSAGCHVLGEKPISNDISQAEEMVALARERGLCYGINLNHRFTALARVARRWVDEGRLGHLLFANMSMWIHNPRESSPWFQVKALHPHTVDVLRYFCGDIRAVQCFAAKAPGRGIFSTAHFNFEFVNGMVGGLTGSYDIARGHPMERLEVAGLDGRMVLEDMFMELRYYPAGSAEKTVITNTPFGDVPEKTFDDTFRNRVHRFAEQVAAGCAPDEIDGSGADGLAAQRVLAAAIRSIETRTVVEVADIGG